MSIPIPKTVQKPPNIKTQDVSNWLNGTVTAFDDGRTPLDGLRSSGNVYLDQDGTVRPRPSLSPYGPQPTGKVLGEIYEFKNVTGLTSTNWLICMQSFDVSVSPSASLSPSSSASSSISASVSPSSSISPSASLSPSGSLSPSSSSSPSRSPSSSLSPSASASFSPSSSRSPSSSVSPSASLSPSSSTSRSVSPSASTSPSASRSPSSSISQSISPSASLSPSASGSPSASLSPSSSLSALPPSTAHAQIFIAKGEDTSWTPVTGKYYDSEAEAHFVQIAGKVLILNGKDNLSYLNISTSTIVPFITLSTPTAPTLTTNNVTGTVFDNYYAITANSTVGETIASATLHVQSAVDRDLWTPATQNILIAWSAVSNAASYNVYEAQVAPGGAPTLYLIASGLTALSFQDGGGTTSPQDTTRPAPTTDSTAGPVASRGSSINGRVFLVGCPDQPYYVRYGGDFGFELDFSPANGGGFTPVSNDKDLPIAVKSFRDAHGDQQITVLCQGTNGKGKRFVLTPDSLTVGATTIEFFDVTEDSGQDGTDSPDAVVLYQDSLWYPSRDGFKTTGTKPQLQNVLTTDRVSNTIQRDITLLNSAAMGGAVGVGFEGRLYFGLPVDASSNNEIWVLDLQRGGAWMKPWNINADWLWLYNDNTGNSHLMVLQDNMMYQLAYINLTSDNGTAFSTEGSSGIIKFSPDGRQWGELIQVVFTILRPQGIINFQLAGRTEDSSDLIPLGSFTLDANPNTTPSGWSEAAYGTYAWSSFPYVPVTTNNETLDVLVDAGSSEVQYWEYSWNSTLAGVDYNLSQVIAEYVPLGIRDLS